MTGCSFNKYVEPILLEDSLVVWQAKMRLRSGEKRERKEETLPAYWHRPAETRT
jgi:hypothetical protein